MVPGTDHASIATEAKIVEKMREEGITKEDIGREKFLDRAWQWKAQYGGRIVSQLKKIGSSCDWDRERFTMDEGCSKAVKEVFVTYTTRDRFIVVRELLTGVLIVLHLFQMQRLNMKIRQESSGI